MTQEWINQHWWLVLAAAAWEIAWKGWALWKAARNDDKGWFVVLLLVNALGVLSIAYIFMFSKRPKKLSTEDK